MRVFIFPLAIVLGFIFQSCTVHSGQVVSLDYGQEVLPKDKAVGIVQVTNILGIGGNDYDVLYEDAKDKLIKDRPLKKREKYVNINVNIKTTGFIIGYTKIYILSADVVKIVDGEYDYREVSTPGVETKEITRLADGSTIEPVARQNGELFIVTDTVMFNKNGNGLPNIAGQIVSKDGNNYRVYYVTPGGSKRYKKFSQNQLCRITGEYKGYRVGESYTKNGEVGKVVGFTDFNMLILTDKSQKKYVEY